MGQCTSQPQDQNESELLGQGFLALNVPLILTDKDGFITSANMAAMRLTERDNLVGHNVTILVSPDIAERHASFIERYKRTRVGNVIGTAGRKVTLITRSKKSVAVLLSVGETGDGFVGAMIDISDTLRLKEEETRTESAVRALKERTQFISFLNHQLRVPMNALSLGVALLQDRRNFEPTSANPEPYQKHIGDMRTSCDQILHLLNDVLDTEKMRANVYRYDYGPADMIQLAHQAKRMALLGNHRSTKVQVQFFVAPFFQRNRFWCDGSRMLQVMTSFLDAAVQKAEPGSNVSFNVACTPRQESPGDAELLEQFGAPSSTVCRPYTLTVQVWFMQQKPFQETTEQKTQKEREEEEGREEVKRFQQTGDDDGRASSDLAALAYVKTELYTPSNTEEHVTGLGLLIAREIVERGHFGSVHRWDMEGASGTTLELRIVGFVLEGSVVERFEDVSMSATMQKNQQKFHDERCVSRSTGLATAAPDEDSDLDHPSSESEGTCRTGHVDVVCVEDDRFNRRIIGRILKGESLQYTTCENGRFAAEWFKTPGNSAKVVIMDRSMPELDGEQAIRQILKVYPKQQIVGLTGDAEEQNVQSMRDAGAGCVLTKPVDFDLLTKVVNDLVQKASSDGNALSPPLP